MDPAEPGAVGPEDQEPEDQEPLFEQFEEPECWVGVYSFINKK